MEIRLFFEIFFTGYLLSDEQRVRKPTEKRKREVKFEILKQLSRVKNIREFPLSIEFEFYAMKDYSVMNYWLYAQWILESMKLRCLLQDFNMYVVKEVKISNTIVEKPELEGCKIIFKKIS